VLCVNVGFRIFLVVTGQPLTGVGNVNGEPRRGRGGRVYRPGGRRPYYGECDGSVYVGALPRTLRVSEFKAEVLITSGTVSTTPGNAGILSEFR